MQILQKLAAWRRFQDRVFRQNFRFAHTLSTAQQIKISSGRLLLNNTISFIVLSSARQRCHEFYETMSLPDDIFAARDSIWLWKEINCAVHNIFDEHGIWPAYARFYPLYDFSMTKCLANGRMLLLNCFKDEPLWCDDTRGKKYCSKNCSKIVVTLARTRSRSRSQCVLYFSATCVTYTCRSRCTSWSRPWLRHNPTLQEYRCNSCYIISPCAKLQLFGNTVSRNILPTLRIYFSPVKVVDNYISQPHNSASIIRACVRKTEGTLGGRKFRMFPRESGESKKRPHLFIFRQVCGCLGRARFCFLTAAYAPNIRKMRRNNDANFGALKRAGRVNKRRRARASQGKSAVRRRQGYVKRFSRASRAVNELNGPGAKAGVKGEFSNRARWNSWLCPQDSELPPSTPPRLLFARTDVPRCTRRGHCRDSRLLFSPWRYLVRPY